MQSYIGQDQSLGPKSPPVGAPLERPWAPESLPRPLPRPPPHAPPPEAPTGRALPQRLHTPRNAKFTLAQLAQGNNMRSHSQNFYYIGNEMLNKGARNSCSPISHHRPCIRTLPISLLLPCFSRSITSTSTLTITIIHILRIFFWSNIINHNTWFCPRVLRFCYKNSNSITMEIFIVKPLNSSICSMWILVRNSSITLWLICYFISVEPYLRPACPLVFLYHTQNK